MGIQVYFYDNFRKRKNSTLIPPSNSGTEYICLLKDDTSVTAPEIELSLASSNPVSYTYAYIPSFSRYYFVNDWTYVLGRWTASLSVDVLASFRTEIGALSPYVLRSSSAYDEDISDALYVATNSWNANETSIPTPFDYSTGEFVIGIISPPSQVTGSTDNEFGCVRYWHCGVSRMKDFITYLMSSVFIQRHLSNAVEGITDSMVKNFSDPLQYIESIRWYPFPTRTIEYPIYQKPKIGWFDTENDNDMPTLGVLLTKYKTFSGDTYSIDIPKNPYASNSGQEYLRFPPYTQYELRYQPFGVIPLNAGLIGGKSKIYFTYTVDYLSGMCRMSVGTQSDKADLGVYNAQVGVDVSLAQITEDVLGASVSMGTGIISAMSSVASASTLMASSSLTKGSIKKLSMIGEAGSMITDGINKFLTGTNDAINQIAPQCERSGTNGMILSYIGEFATPVLIMRYCGSVGTAPEYFGRPLYKKITSIGAVPTGTYLLCGEGADDINGYSIERLAIDEYLTGGFFYE